MPEARFSLYHCRQILRKGGARQASTEAAEELCMAMEDVAMEISKRAALFADDAARRKVMREDVRNAVKEFLESSSSR